MAKNASPGSSTYPPLHFHLSQSVFVSRCSAVVVHGALLGLCWGVGGSLVEQDAGFLLGLEPASEPGEPCRARAAPCPVPSLPVGLDGAVAARPLATEACWAVCRWQWGRGVRGCPPACAPARSPESAASTTSVNVFFRSGFTALAPGDMVMSDAI